MARHTATGGSPAGRDGAGAGRGYNTATVGNAARAQRSRKSTTSGAKTRTSMFTLSVRSITSHKLRLGLTLLSVVLGTAFIAGSLMFTSSLSRAFNSIVDLTLDDVDAVVQTTGQPSHPGAGSAGNAGAGGAEAGGGGAAAQGAPSGHGLQNYDANRLEKELRQRPDVDRVNIFSQHTVVLATQDHHAIQTGGAPTILEPYYEPDKAVVEETDLIAGHAPVGSHQALINSSAAEKHGIKIGDEMLIVDSHQKRTVTISGIYRYELDTGGYVGVLMNEDAFRREYQPYANTRFTMRAAAGISDEELVSHLKQDYPELEVQTGKELADEVSGSISKALSFVNYFLIAFGLIALLVGAFIIANTFSMIVAQRLREFSLLRSLGASQKQITTSVLFEALLVGIIGSALGILAGMGIVKLLYSIMNAVGAGLPAGGISLTPAAVITPFVLGLGVTLFSAWAPARRAGTVRPIEALRSGDATSSNSLTIRTSIGAALLVIGVILALVGVLTTSWKTGLRAGTVGGAAASIVLGTFLVSPALARLIIPLLGRVIGAPFGAIGRLARTNSQRNPRRTAATAFALTLGVALVGSIGMLGAAMKHSINQQFDNSVTADFIIAAPQNGFGGSPTQTSVPQRAMDAIRHVDGVEIGVGVGIAPVAIGKASGMPFSNVMEGDPTKVMEIHAIEGDMTLQEPGFLASRKTAAENHWQVGESYPVVAPNGATLTHIPLRGIYEENQALLGQYVIGWAGDLTEVAKNIRVDEAQTSGTIVQAMLVKLAPGADANVVRERLAEATRDYIVLQVMTPKEFSNHAAAGIDQMMNTLYALLGLALIVAVLGIINTLALNVAERRQEIGMLRAIGSQRRQIRRLITLESVQISLYGALVGLVIGLGLGWAFIEVLAAAGLSGAVIPWPLIGSTLIGTLVVGVVAAIWPAIRASRTPPLDAIAED